MSDSYKVYNKKQTDHRDNFELERDGKEEKTNPNEGTNLADSVMASFIGGVVRKD
jgi:hypothetical protein